MAAAARGISFSFALLTVACATSATMTAGCGGAQGHTDHSKLLPVGAEVPSLVRVDHRGKPVSLRGGPPTLLYFYPKDGTPGCTKEACAFRDSWEKYDAAKVRVIGVSTDTEERHREFADEHNLPFSLIADPQRTWSDAFGVGKFMGGMDERVSFLIDGQGRVAKVYANVDPGLHANEVLADAKQLGLAP